PRVIRCSSWLFLRRLGRQIANSLRQPGIVRQRLGTIVLAPRFGLARRGDRHALDRRRLVRTAQSGDHHPPSERRYCKYAHVVSLLRSRQTSPTTAPAQSLSLTSASGELPHKGHPPVLLKNSRACYR